MGIERVFRDVNGIEWRVSHVVPVSAVSDSLPSGSAPDENVDGWLSFEAGWLERRITPVPENWQLATIGRLEQMCRIATRVQREQTAIASHRLRIPVEPVAEATVDTTPAQGSEAVSTDIAGLGDHVSLLANAWPARESRITFRG